MTHRFGSPTPYDEAEFSRRKKKRYLSRSDEEIREEMDQKELAYRRGWPNLLPLPLETISHNAISMIENATERLQNVETILTAQRISNPRFFFAFRVPHDVEDVDNYTELTKYLTLVLTANFTTDAHKLDNTIIQIRSSFRTHESTENVTIEVLDFRAMHRVPSYPIRYTETNILQQWSRVAEAVKRILEGRSWLSLELLHRGLSDAEQDCPPTVVITSPKATDPLWYETILPNVRKAIGALAPTFEVELLGESTVFGARRRYEPTKFVDKSAYSRQVLMGSSIGIWNDERGSSTLGGAVTLEGDIRCGITNWHCVLDERLAKVVSKSKSGALEPGNMTLANFAQGILSPSTSDHHGCLGTIQRRIDVHAAAAARGNEEHNVQRKRADDEFKQCEKFPRLLGNVYAGSGRRTISVPKYLTEKRTGKLKENSNDLEYLFPLDWALLQIADTETREAINMMPDQAPPANTTPGTKLVRNHPCEEWTIFDTQKEEVLVAKFGRTTGWTLGTVNAALIAINPANDAEVSEAYGFTMETPGWAFGVTNRIAREDFLERGDSGSILIHDGSGAWLGLLFGISGAGQGYFIPMDVIFKDIKTATGKSVTIPPYVDPTLVGLARYQLD